MIGANVVADALSRKSTGNLTALLTTQKHILEDLRKMRIAVRFHEAEYNWQTLKFNLP